VETPLPPKGGVSPPGKKTVATDYLLGIGIPNNFNCAKKALSNNPCLFEKRKLLNKVKSSLQTPGKILKPTLGEKIPAVKGNFFSKHSPRYPLKVKGTPLPKHFSKPIFVKNPPIIFSWTSA